MKANHIAIIRFGSPILIRADKKALATLSVENEEAMYTGNQIGIVFLLNTDHTLNEVIKAFKDAEVECSDNTPFIIFDLKSKDINVHFKFFINSNIFDVYRKQFMGESGNDVTADVVVDVDNMSLDDLLEKINKVGMNGLTTNELIRLKKLTQG